MAPAAHVLASLAGNHERGGQSDQVRARRPGGESSRPEQAGCRSRGGRGALDDRGSAAPWRRGERVRVRQVPRQRPRRPDGRQPPHRREDSDRGLACAALHGRQRAEERGEGPLSPQLAFGDLLAARVAERRSQIVLGIDPDPSALWPTAAHSNGSGEAPREPRGEADLGQPAVAAVLEHCRALLDAAAGACVAAKLQLARFEALGPAGWAALRTVAEHARRLGLLVIADGKRGDIDVSARAYGSALFGGLETPFGRLEGLGADLATVNPLMGRDALWPLVSAARAAGGGVLVLVRTSGSGAADIEDLPLRGGGTVWERLAAIVEELGADGLGAVGLS